MTRIVIGLFVFVLFSAPQFAQSSLLPLTAGAGAAPAPSPVSPPHRGGSGVLTIGAGANVGATAVWDPYTTLSAVPESTMAGPIFDAFGNAWVVISDNTNLSARQWSASTGTWQAPHILGPALSSTITVGLAVDQAGAVYITYNAALAGTQPPYALMWAKYSPVSGWTEPSLFYNSPDGVGSTVPAIDALGRLVVVFSGNGVSSIVYDPATSSWGPVQNLAPGNTSPINPSVGANKSGSRLALVYLYGLQMKYSFFNSASASWNPPTTLPGSQFATFNAGGPGAFYPIVADDAGNVTLGITTYFFGLWGAVGFRYENGQWSSRRLITGSRSAIAMDGFGSAAINSSGEVLIAAPGPTDIGSTDISVFRYRPGKGWRVETAATYPSSRVTGCKVAWFQGTQAVVTYAGADDSDGEQNALYSNGKWAPGPHLPGTTVTFWPGIGTAPNGDVLFTLSFTANGSLATWLRP